jgi:aconitate hydratase
MSPEFGSTAAIFPIDDVTLEYLRLTGRSDEQIDLVEAYVKEQGMWHDPSEEITFSEYLELDLSTVVPSISGPKRPQDRISLTDAKAQFHEDIKNYATHVDDNASGDTVDDVAAQSFPASDAPGYTADDHQSEADRPREHHAFAEDGRPSKQVPVTMPDGREFELDHGAVSIASITSCTNTSNPSVMMAAAVLARNAVEKGLKAKPWVKTSIAPGSKVVTDYYEKSGLVPALEELGFFIVGYGCTTCIGNSGPLEDEISQAIQDNDLAVTSVLSGNRNFEGRINPDVKMNYLASPPLVIAYALAGNMDFDFESESLGQDADGNEVYLKDIWPDPAEVQKIIDASIDTEMFTREYGTIFDGDERWQNLDTPTGKTFEWNPESTYVRKPPYFEGMTMETTPVEDITGARVLLKLGDSVTTDHISPAGSFKSDTPAGKYLIENGVQRKDFNSYGSRRGNHEVMIRGTFANIRIKNQLLDGVEGGYTRDFTQEGGPQAAVYDASINYQEAGVPLVVLGGKEYGSGSSRDWAAKGTSLLGVKAVIAESYERIHRSNLIGMGVLPLQYPAGESADSLGLEGTETFDIQGVTGLNEGTTPKTLKVTATKEDGSTVEFDAVLRIDTPGEADYYRNGGILQYVLRNIAKS